MIDENKIKYIDEDNYKNIYVVSDIHGKYNLFIKLLEKINFSKYDLLLILGDSCDRGHQSFEIYTKVIRLQKEKYNVIHLFGNHEQLFKYGVRNKLDRDLWFSNGGKMTVYSFYLNSVHKDLDIKEWFKEYFISESYDIRDKIINSFPLIVVGKNNIFTHGSGLDLSQKLLHQNEDDVIWGISNFWDTDRKLDFYKNKSFYFGHIYHDKIFYYADNVICVDAGATIYNHLGCIEVKSGKEIYVTENNNK